MTITKSVNGAQVTRTDLIQHVTCADGTALPTANTNFLAQDIKPRYGPSVLYVDICLSIAGVLTITRTETGGSAKSALCNSGNALTAGIAYQFSILAREGDTFNFKLSTTTGTINWLVVMEAGAGL